MLTVTVQAMGDSVILRCKGRIVRGEEKELLCAVITQRGRHVVLDLAEVDTIDAAGVGVLISLQAAGIYLQLANPAMPILEILKLTGLDSVFEITKSTRPEESAAELRAS